MERAARDTAAERQAVLAARCATDPATLARVVARLRNDTAPVEVLSRHDHLTMPADTLERRSYTMLRSAS
jgi:hypothetical protein